MCIRTDMGKETRQINTYPSTSPIKKIKYYLYRYLYQVNVMILRQNVYKFEQYHEDEYSKKEFFESKNIFQNI